jgi:hypothetical protein
MNRSIPFQCIIDIIEDGDYWHEEWEGTTEILRAERYPCEIQIRARQTGYHTVIGRYEHGYYLVIPMKDIGAGISFPEDARWNTEHLIQAGVPPVDAYSIGAGLKAAAPYLPR